MSNQESKFSIDRVDDSWPFDIDPCHTFVNLVLSELDLQPKHEDCTSKSASTVKWFACSRSFDGRHSHFRKSGNMGRNPTASIPTPVSCGSFHDSIESEFPDVLVPFHGLLSKIIFTTSPGGPTGRQRIHTFGDIPAWTSRTQKFGRFNNQNDQAYKRKYREKWFSTCNMHVSWSTCPDHSHSWWGSFKTTNTQRDSANRNLTAENRLRADMPIRYSWPCSRWRLTEVAVGFSVCENETASWDPFTYQVLLW